MKTNIETLLDSYWEWVRQQTTVSVLEDWHEITTPYIDRHNDCIQIYVRIIDDGHSGSPIVSLTDGGETIRDLAHSGYSIATGKRKAVLNEILNGFGISLDQDDLSLNAKTPINDFPVTEHNLIQAILAINDMAYMSSSPRSMLHSEFRKMVHKEIQFLPWEVDEKPSFEGKSGLTRKFDFMVRGKTDTIIQCFESLDRQKSEVFTFSWLDAMAAYSSAAIKCSVLIQGQPLKRVSNNALAVLEAYDIIPVIVTNGIQEALDQLGP